jgi:hypothetical protein
MNAMPGPSEWNSQSVNECFIYRGKDAHLRWKECVAKAKHSTACEAFADEAAAKASVYDYLDGKSFLRSREELVRALHELTRSALLFRTPATLFRRFQTNHL